MIFVHGLLTRGQVPEGMLALLKPIRIPNGNDTSRDMGLQNNITAHRFVLTVWSCPKSLRKSRLELPRTSQNFMSIIHK